MIAAVGEKVDSDLFTANGVALDQRGKGRPRTPHADLDGRLLLGGDAMRGPATVVEGIADAASISPTPCIGSVHSVDASPHDAARRP